jgi:hypothetical protein
MQAVTPKSGTLWRQAVFLATMNLHPPMQVMNINTTVIVNTHITDVDFSPTVYGVWR